MDLSVNLGRQVWDFSDGALLTGEGDGLKVLCPAALKSIGISSAREIDMLMAYVLSSEIVRPNAPKTSTNTAIISANPRGNRDTTYAPSAYTIPYTARRANLRRLLLKMNKVCEYVCVLAESL